MKAEALILTFVFAGSCAPPEEDPPVAPEAIGDELMRITGAWSSCSGGAHLYRDGRELQSQCFGSEDEFLYENRAILSPEAEATLELRLTEADLSNTEPVNYKGLCGASDAIATVTMWVGGEQVSFEQFCVAEGVLPLYEQVEAAWTELSSCGDGPLELLTAIEPGCRTH